MNNLTKTLLTTLVLGMSSTVAFADESVESIQATSNMTGGDACAPSAPCNGEIKVSLEIPKKCTLKVNTPVIAMTQVGSSNNWSGAGNFDVTANSSYSLAIVAPNKLTSSTGTIPVSVKTSLGGANYTSGTTLGFLASARNFKVQADSSNVDPSTTQAGTYTGTYTVAVNF